MEANGVCTTAIPPVRSESRHAYQGVRSQSRSGHACGLPHCTASSCLSKHIDSGKKQEGRTSNALRSASLTQEVYNDFRYCIVEGIPNLQSEQVVVVAISGDDDARKYTRFLRDHRVALETHRDPSRQISKSLGTYMFPESYVIQDGRTIRKVVGAIDWMSEDIGAFVRNRSAITKEH
jgi:hypothetical protein